MEKDDDYYFIWAPSLKGLAAAITLEPWVPKNTVFKIKLEPDDKRSLRDLINAYPAPAV